jgi:class 3 adenylate cyclase
MMGNFYGYEVSTEGDAFLVAFHDPFDAVAWCLATQLAMHCKLLKPVLFRRKKVVYI